MFFSFVCFGWYLLINGLRKTRRRVKKQQIKYFLLGTGIGFLGGSTNYFLWYGVSILPYGNILVVLGVLLVALAILKYHLFEIRIILTELLVGAMAIILVVLPFLMPTFSLRILVAFIFFIFCVIGYLLVKATHKEIERREKIEKLSQELNKLNQTLEQKVKQRTKELEKAKRFAEVQREIAEERARRLEETHMRLLKKE